VIASLASILFRRRFDWPASTPLVVLGQGDFQRATTP
jgi:hypothetical protein